MKSLYQWSRLSLGLLTLLALPGCTDLDTAPQGNTVTEDQKTELYRRVPERASAAVNGVMSLFSRAEATAGGHGDFGYPSVMLGFDLLHLGLQLVQQRDPPRRQRSHRPLPPHGVEQLL